MNYFILENGKPFLLLGPPGTGKSVYIKDLLNRKLDHDKFASVTLYFTSNTSPTTTQDIIMSKLDKRRKGDYPSLLQLILHNSIYISIKSIHLFHDNISVVVSDCNLTSNRCVWSTSWKKIYCILRRYQYT